MSAGVEREAGRETRFQDCEHGYFAAGGSVFCPQCFAQGGSTGPFDAAELVEWAEKYGHPEEWAKRAQAAHGRAEKAEALLTAAEEQLRELREAVREHRNAYLRQPDEYPAGTDEEVRHYEADLDRKLWATLDRIEGTDNG